MADQIQSTINSKALILKLKANLDRINSRLATSNSTSITRALTEMNLAFSEFFNNLKDPEFSPEPLLSGDSARSEVYNRNLKAIAEDLNRFYQETTTLSNAQIKAFNFSQVLVSEIIKRANGLASTVLDLNILNSFNRSDTIVAGDDFKNTDYIDNTVTSASTPVEILSNGSGVGLARVGVTNVLANSKIDILPISPSNGSDGVNTKPTAGNIERFYEGNYYNFIGSARPEGGKSFNIKYIVTAQESTVTTTNGVTQGAPPSADVGYFAEVGASKEDKDASRKKMIDGDPSTFWECEYLYRIPDIYDRYPARSQGQASPTTPPPSPDGLAPGLTLEQDPNLGTPELQVDLEAAERRALLFDTDQRDLVIDIVITLSSPQRINFLTINPVIFGVQSFPEVEDIATASSNDGEFITVDGWNSLLYSKTITPEANEFLTDSQIGATLSPSRNNYLGQGVYPFPARDAKKIKVRIRSRTPVPSPYERTYALLKHQIDTEITTTTTTKKGAFRF